MINFPRKFGRNQLIQIDEPSRTAPEPDYQPKNEHNWSYFVTFSQLLTRARMDLLYR
jgi:hypothetical protein